MYYIVVTQSAFYSIFIPAWLRRVHFIPFLFQLGYTECILFHFYSSLGCINWFVPSRHVQGECRQCVVINTTTTVQ